MIKVKACGMCAIVFLLIGNLSFSIYSHINKKSETQEIEVKIPVSEDLIRIEAKLDAIYEECKLRDSAIYRTLLELRQEITGQQTIDQRNKIAEL
jgi:hypothetical protein|tara:strand:+ start:586 stop:870 length:285 start_codon:yes stop_codon:yes gene_type:complete